MNLYEIRRELHKIPELDFEEIKPQKIEVNDQKKIIQSSLQNPVDSSSLQSFLQKKDNILIIVNDATRSTPTALIISTIYDKIKSKNINFLIALGTHRKPTEAELKNIFKAYYSEFKDNIICHDADNDDMSFLGTTSFGTPVKINSKVLKADGVIVISSVEPHYFAGFTGGRKSYLPGVAAFSSIEKNHELALREEARILQLESNPVHEDMKEAAEMIDTDTFCILSVLNTNDEVFYTSSGDIHKTLQNASQRVMEVFAPKIRSKADIVIAIVQPPLNRNLYQAQKGLENCKGIIKDNGIFILVTDCAEGIGNDSFYRLMSSSNSAKEVLQKVNENYKLGYHKAAKFVTFMQDHKFWLVSKMDADILERIFIKNYCSLQKAVNSAIKLKGQTAKIMMVKNSGNIVPRI